VFLQPVHHPSTDPTEALESDLELMTLLDRLGYDEAWVGEHHSTGWENIASPEVFIAAASRHTERIRLGAGVVQLGLHHPLVLLDRMILLDHLTRGRTTFGVGAGGGLPSDLTVAGLTVEEAGRRMGESLEAMLRLLDGEAPVSMRTDWFEISEAVLQLRPYSDPHMPFAAASTHPSNVELMGKVGGAVLLGPVPERVGEVFQSLKRGAETAGVEAGRGQIALSYKMHIDEDRDRAIADYKDGSITEELDFNVDVLGRPRPAASPDEWYRGLVDKMIIGDPDDAVEKVERIQEVSGGVGAIIFQPRDWAGAEAQRRSFELFASEVAPRFR